MFQTTSHKYHTLQFLQSLPTTVLITNSRLLARNHRVTITASTVVAIQINEMENVDPIPQVRTYVKNYPRLTPLDSQENDHPAAAINVGDEILDEHIMAASHQHNHRKALLKSNHATPLEVIASKKRKTGLLLESVSTVPIGPDWAQAILQGMNDNTNTLRLVNERLTENTNTLRLMNVRFDRMDERFDRMDERFDRMDLSLIQQSIQTARNTNRSLLADETITPVVNNNGDVPPLDVFPMLQLHIGLMAPRAVNRLLDFYGIVPARRADMNHKKALLCSHLGLLRLADAF